jgi:hypothetical protein
MATAAATLIEVSVPEEAPLPSIEEEGVTAVALSAWRRASCPESVFAEEWLSAEECILLPH